MVDLYSAKQGKDIVDDHKNFIRSMLRQEAKRLNKNCTYKCTPLTIMELVNKIHDGLAEELQKSDWIVHHMRPAGHLAYRPSVQEHKLVPTDNDKYKGQAWLKQHPLSGGGKI